MSIQVRQALKFQKILFKKNVYQNHTIILNDINIENNINQLYTLISDIEVAEAEVFFEDKQSLINCERIIVEVENTEKYSKNIQISKIKNLECYGNVFVFQKIN